MTKKEKRKQREQKQKEENILKMKLRMSPEELMDVEARGMNTQDGIPQYLYEIKEVKRAIKRMLLIDKAVSEMSTDEQSARDHRLERQKRAALTNEDLYLLSDDTYDAWAAGVLPAIGVGTC